MGSIRDNVRSSGRKHILKRGSTTYFSELSPDINKQIINGLSEILTMFLSTVSFTLTLAKITFS